MKMDTFCKGAVFFPNRAVGNGVPVSISASSHIVSFYRFHGQVLLSV